MSITMVHNNNHHNDEQTKIENDDEDPHSGISSTTHEQSSLNFETHNNGKGNSLRHSPKISEPLFSDNDTPMTKKTTTDHTTSRQSDQKHLDLNTNNQSTENLNRDELKSTHAQTNQDSDLDKSGLASWFKGILGRKTDDTLRQAIEEYIEETGSNEETTSLAVHEKTLISNVLKLRDLNTADVMIPRADIISFDLNQPVSDFLSLLSENPHSRVPVYKSSVDDIIGTIHIKDVLKELSLKKDLSLEPLIRNVPIVSPAMPILDLLLQMRETRKHMVLVIDEFGGIDGLVTIGDVIEAIVGEFYDEHDQDTTPLFIEKSDGSIVADARVSIDDFEEKVCSILTEEERDDIDTLGGLVFAISGRIPARGEVLKHNASGLVFEIIDADPRRIKKMRIQNLP